MKSALFFLLFVINCSTSFSQQKKKTIEQKHAPEVISMTYSSSWGPIKNGEVPIVQIVSTLPAPLIVKDQFAKLYEVVSFRINYSFKSTYKDEETQQVKSTKDFRVMDFNNTSKLSSDWIDSIKDNIKAGDQILLNKILFRNKEGKLQFAGDIKISVK